MILGTLGSIWVPSCHSTISHNESNMDEKVGRGWMRGKEKRRGKEQGRKGEVKATDMLWYAKWYKQGIFQFFFCNIHTIKRSYWDHWRVDCNCTVYHVVIVLSCLSISFVPWVPRPVYVYDVLLGYCWLQSRQDRKTRKKTTEHVQYQHEGRGEGTANKQNHTNAYLILVSS